MKKVYFIFILLFVLLIAGLVMMAKMKFYMATYTDR